MNYFEYYTSEFFYYGFMLLSVLLYIVFILFVRGRDWANEDYNDRKIIEDKSKSKKVKNKGFYKERL